MYERFCAMVLVLPLFFFGGQNPARIFACDVDGQAGVECRVRTDATATRWRNGATTQALASSTCCRWATLRVIGSLESGVSFAFAADFWGLCCSTGASSVGFLRFLMSCLTVGVVYGGSAPIDPLTRGVSRGEDQQGTCYHATITRKGIKTDKTTAVVFIHS